MRIRSNSKCQTLLRLHPSLQAQQTAGAVRRHMVLHTTTLWARPLSRVISAEGKGCQGASRYQCRPNNALQLTAYSLRSFVASASGIS